MAMKNLVAEIYLDATQVNHGSALLYMGGPGGKECHERFDGHPHDGQDLQARGATKQIRGRGGSHS